MAPLHTNRRPKRSKKFDRRNFILLAIVAIIVALVILLVSVLVKLLTPSAPTPDQPQTPTIETEPVSQVEMPLPQSFVDHNTSAKHIVLYDLNANKVLYSKNAKERCYPASTTKLLTCLVTLKYANEKTVFTVGNEIRLIDPQSSRAYLQVGQKLDLQTILEAIMLPSGNDAAYTAAANIGRMIAKDNTLTAHAAVTLFCEEMNKVAKELGANDSHFVNPDGIHNVNHYTTANDLTIIAKAALEQPLLAKVVAEDKVVRTFLSGESGVTWHNTNVLLDIDSRYHLEGATGLKTGHTDEAGYCLIASAERDGVKLLAVVMNAESTNERFEDAHGLLTVCYDALD